MLSQYCPSEGHNTSCSLRRRICHMGLLLLKRALSYLFSDHLLAKTACKLNTHSKLMTYIEHMKQCNALCKRHVDRFNRSSNASGVATSLPMLTDSSVTRGLDLAVSYWREEEVRLLPGRSPMSLATAGARGGVDMPCSDCCPSRSEEE